MALVPCRQNSSAGEAGTAGTPKEAILGLRAMMVDDLPIENAGRGWMLSAMFKRQRMCSAKGRGNKSLVGYKYKMDSEHLGLPICDSLDMISAGQESEMNWNIRLIKNKTA